VRISLLITSKPSQGDEGIQETTLTIQGMVQNIQEILQIKTIQVGPKMPDFVSLIMQAQNAFREM